MISRKKILITGGTGSLGTALTQSLYNDNQLTLLSRDWQRSAAASRRFPLARMVLTDICTPADVIRACQGQDILIHAAANKDVGTGSYHPIEFNRVNVLGSVNIAQAWWETHREIPSAPAILVSTDKAVNPLNTYGANKKVAEAIFRSYDYSVVRYGNVIDSRGAFLERWASGGPITVRTPDPTRFMMTLADAVAMVIELLDHLLNGGENGVYIPRQVSSFSIEQVARRLRLEYQTQPLLPFEKQHERLLAEGETVKVVNDTLCQVIPGYDNVWKAYQSDYAPSGDLDKVLKVWEALNG